MHKEGIDYSEVHAPMARLEIVRLVVALESLKCWKLWQIDVESTFLNDLLVEEAYVTQPLRFVKKGNEHKVLRLRNELYVLKQAPRTSNIEE